MKQTVIIVAGGKGNRMGTELPKQFLPLRGKPILFHTLEVFKKALPQADLILVLPKAEMSRWQVMAHGTEHQDVTIVAGGQERFHSVKAGLDLVQSGIVGIHDSVRPLVSQTTIQSAFETASQKGSAVPVVALKDSLRKVNQSASVSKNRAEYVLVQTPQCFDVAKLKVAYQAEFSTNFTDDASVFEAAGNQVELTQGNSENIKITTPEDIVIAEALLGGI